MYKDLFDVRNRKHHRHFLIIAFVSILVLSLGMSANQAFAMGQSPGTCPNRYDSTITQMTLNNGTHTFDPIQNPGITFRANAHSGYSVYMTLHTVNQSSQGNQDNGTTWYSSNNMGFSNGSCVYDIGPNEDKIRNSASTWNYVGWGPDTYPQLVSFSTIPFNQVTFTVDWYDPLAPQYLSAMAVSSSQIDLNWSPPLNDNGSQIIGYKIQRNVNDVTGWTTIVSNTNSASTTYSDNGLSPNTKYWYRVFAISSDGTTSSASNPTFTTTLPTIKLTVNAQDVLGNPISGIWMELHSANGTTIATGYTPVTFDAEQGTKYAVYASNYLHYVFLHWNDGSMNNPKNITPTGDVTITATYTP